MLAISGYRGVEVKRYDSDELKRSDEDLAKYRVVRTGQLAVNTMWLNYCGLGVSQIEGHMSPDYKAYWIRPDFNRNYLNYLLRSDAYVAGYTMYLTGVRPNSLRIDRDSLMSLPIVTPPPQEQEQIARFLDGETAKIEALIAKQEQLIATLREDRTATITHAVTKGIDPDVEMKDSGVEWLGDIPAHWTHSFVKFVCTMLSGFPFKSEGFSHEPDDIPLLRGANVGVDHIDWTDVVYWPQSEANLLGDYELEPGDIVMGLDRPFISTGIRLSRIGAADVPCLLLQRVLRLRAVSGFDQDYLSFVLTGPGIVHHLTPMFTGVSVPHVSPDQVGSLPLPQPPVTEQRQIVAYLNDRCGKIDGLAAKSTQVIDTLREYRSALITDAVTGQIDVRRAA
jgi:type I restriction enzyme S subunit